MINPVTRVVRYIRREGFKPFLLAVLDRSANRLRPAAQIQKHSIRMLVRYEDALEVDWSKPAP